MFVEQRKRLLLFITLVLVLKNPCLLVHAHEQGEPACVFLSEVIISDVTDLILLL